LWIGKDSLLLKAEVKYLVEEEMACRLADVVFRRTGIGTAECPNHNWLKDAAQYMGEILGWDAAQIENEVEEVFNRYTPLTMDNPSRENQG
jgi:glycerol-3-phosphate dehydrogenase